MCVCAFLYLPDTLIKEYVFGPLDRLQLISVVSAREVEEEEAEGISGHQELEGEGSAEDIGERRQSTEEGWLPYEIEGDNERDKQEEVYAKERIEAAAKHVMRQRMKR